MQRSPKVLFVAITVSAFARSCFVECSKNIPSYVNSVSTNKSSLSCQDEFAASSVEDHPPFDIDSSLRRYWRTLTQRVCTNLHYKSCKGVPRENWSDANLTRVLATPISSGSLEHVPDNNVHSHGAPQGYRWGLVGDCPARSRPVPQGADPLLCLLGSPGDAERETLTEADTCYIGSKVVAPAAVTVGPHYGPTSCMLPAATPRAWVPPPGDPGALRGEEAAVRQGGIIFLPCCNEHLKAQARKRGPRVGGRGAPSTGRNAVHAVHSLGNPPDPPNAASPLRRPRISRLLLWGDSTTKRQWLMLMMLARQHCRIEWMPHLFEEQYVPEACQTVPPDAFADPELEAVLKDATEAFPGQTSPSQPTPSRCREEDPGREEATRRRRLTRASEGDAEAVTSPGTLGDGLKYIVYIDGMGCRDLGSIRWDLEETTRDTDLLVINVGLHCILGHSFHQWQSYISSLAPFLATLPARVVWRSNFGIKEHVWRNKKEWAASMQAETDARRFMFDSYAEDVMRSHGITVWDVHGILNLGEYRPA
eukprot:jgi/Botrbrau1/14617/Bobra.0364s0001.1